MLKKLQKMMISIFILSLVFSIIPINDEANAQTPTLLTYGSSNGDVWDLQYRLKQLNYSVDIDGIYGYQTLNVVKKFQSNYGLMIDGIVGPITWKTLKKYSLSQDEFNLLARLVYSEARGEPYEGQVAVAAVALNRVHSKKFPNDLKSVIFQEHAFTAVADGQFWLTPNETVKLAALDAIRGWDPSKGALYYFNPDTATSAWIWSRPQILKIGDHIFTK